MMTDSVEKLTVKISEAGLELTDGNQGHIRLTAVEALMLSDILQAEAHRLRQIADEQSPLPMRFVF